MSGVTAQSDVAGAGKVSVGVLWHFCGFHRNLLTWDRAITISRTGSSLSLSGSLHRQLIPTDSNPELWAVCGPSPLHYLCWVHQPSKGTSGAKSLLRWPQVQSPHVTHSRSMRKCMHLDPFCWQKYDLFSIRSSLFQPLRWMALASSGLWIFQESVISSPLLPDSKGHTYGDKKEAFPASPGEGRVNASNNFLREMFSPRLFTLNPFIYLRWILG